jgi:hypothetical protein
MVPRIEYRESHPDIAEFDGSVARFHLMQNDEWRMQNGKETAEAKRRQVAAATKKTKEQKDSRGDGREKAQKEIRLRTACLRRDEEGVRWLPKGCLAKPRLSDSVLAKAHLVAAATHLRCAAVSVGRVSDLFA